MPTPPVTGTPALAGLVVPPPDSPLPPAADHAAPPAPLSWWRRWCQPPVDTQWQRIAPLYQPPQTSRAIRRHHRDLTARATASVTCRVRDGWWIGPAPYGYRPIRTRAFLPATARWAWRTTLVLDPARAAAVPVLFDWHLTGNLDAAALLQRVLADPDRFPPSWQPGRGLRPWTTACIRTVLDTPAYLGYSVWGRTHHRHPQPVDTWVFSETPAHPALVTAEVFWSAYRLNHPDADIGR